MRKNLKIFLFALLLFFSFAFLTNAYAAGFFSLPVSSSTPISAYFDLNPASGYIRDWTGWTGRNWIYGHAYDGHKGTDYDGQEGNPIYTANKYPDWARTVYTYNYNGNAYPNGPIIYGTHIIISHDNTTYKTVYAHLKYNSILTWVGNSYNYSFQCAQMGNTGYSSGDHLHFEVRSNDTPICPYYNGLMS